MIRPEEAWRRLEPHLAPLAPETVARAAGLGRVVAQPLLATTDVPAQDVSAMDGYAVAGEPEPDTPLPVVGTVSAGTAPGQRLSASSAVRIMTGAPVPNGADRVVPIELTDAGEREVLVREAVGAGAHIRRAGEVLHRGEELLPEGACLTSGALALLASQGIHELSVHRRPGISVLTGGDEVVAPEVTPQPGQLRDSHTDFLLGACRRLGIEADSLGIASDEPEELRRRLAEAGASEIALTTGGVSMGAFDFVEQALSGLGWEILFHGVAIQPGKPLLAARHEDGLLFGLPGNPGSVQCCFRLFVQPALRRLMGHEDGFWHDAAEGQLGEEVRGRPDRDRFLTARRDRQGGHTRLRPIRAVGSHDLSAWAHAQALLRVPAGIEGLPAGARCEYAPL